MPSETIKVSVESSNPCDYSAFVLGANGKVVGEDYFIFYNNEHSPDGAVTLKLERGGASYTLNLPAFTDQVSKTIIALTPEVGSIAKLNQLRFRVRDGDHLIASGAVETVDRSEAALILGEVYRYKDSWKFRFVDQGFDGGLKPLAEHYGVEVEDDTNIKKEDSAVSQDRQATSSSNAAAPGVNLSKVVLTKEKPKINLEKKSSSYGRVMVNLNWNRLNQERRGLFGRRQKKQDAVDLDLAAYIRLKNGDQTIIQALGDRFGDFQRAPFVELQGDDRTGDAETGEWLAINGNQLDKIDEIMVFTFIYEGVANWQETDARVVIYVNDHPPVETFLTEGSNDLGLCAIARLKNIDGELAIERLNRYFFDHKAMDEAFGWGFSWKRGYK